MPENVNDAGTAAGRKVVKRNGLRMLFLHEELGAKGGRQFNYRANRKQPISGSAILYPNCMTFCPGEQERLVADSP